MSWQLGRNNNKPHGGNSCINVTGQAAGYVVGGSGLVRPLYLLLAEGAQNINTNINIITITKKGAQNINININMGAQNISAWLLSQGSADFLWSHGLISDGSADEIRRACGLAAQAEGMRH